MLRVLRCGGGGLTPVEAGPDWVLPDDVAWIDLTESRSRPKSWSPRQALGVQSCRPAEEMAEIEVSSRLYQEDGGTFMTAFVLVGADERRPRRWRRSPSCWPRGRLVTIRYVEPRAFAAYAAQAERDSDFCQGGVDAFLGLLDAIIDRLADILEKTSAEVDDRPPPTSSGRPATVGFKPLLRQLGPSAVDHRQGPQQVWSACPGCCRSRPWPTTSPAARTTATACARCSGTCSR
jgi:magnesium transporter